MNCAFSLFALERAAHGCGVFHVVRAGRFLKILPRFVGAQFNRYRRWNIGNVLVLLAAAHQHSNQRAQVFNHGDPQINAHPTFCRPRGD